MAGVVFSEASGLQDSIYGKVQAPIRAFIEKRGEAFEQNSVVKEVFQMSKSKHFGETLTAMTAMNGFQPVGENGNFPMDHMQENYKKFIQHMTWRNSFAITKEMMEDSKVMELKKEPDAFTTSYYRTRERFGAAVLGGAISGKTSTVFNNAAFDIAAADGQPLFSKAHPSILNTKRTQSNLFADAFSNDALGAIESKMQDFRGDNNEVLDVAPTTIIIPNEYTLKRDVFAAIGADKDPATANNGFNYTFGRWNVIVWQYLNEFITAGTKPWVVMDSRYNQTYGSAVWLDRTDLDVHSYVDESNRSNVWTGDARYNATFNDWRAFAVGGVSGGTTLIA